MSIPLVQEATKDAINTSIIVIKRNIERINMLLGLMDSGSSDLSGLATKQELQDAVNSLQPVDEVTLNNMQSVTSNAVSKAMSYSTEEHFTGRYWIDGKKIYETVITGINVGQGVTNYQVQTDVMNAETVIKVDSIQCLLNRTIRSINCVAYGGGDWQSQMDFDTVTGLLIISCGRNAFVQNGIVTLDYTKTTD